MATKTSPLTLLPPYKPRLYLARGVMEHPPTYFLRLSCWDDTLKCMVSRQVFDLGTDPEKYIVYIGEQGFYIAEELIDQIDTVIDNAEDLLEKLLYIFVNPLVRRNLERFKSRKDMRSAPLNAKQEEAIRHELDDFDRRRLHYLLYGSIDQSRLYQLPGKVARKLLGMSRDQREQYFVEQERGSLHEEEVRNYLFAIFHLSRFFDQSYVSQAPQMLEEEKVDTYFIQELCALDDKKSFWQGMQRGPGLPEYLKRYACLWIDYQYGGNPLLDDYLRRFMNDHRKFSFPESAEKITKEEYQEIFGASYDELKKMNKRELTRLYRQKAMRLHPDTGGDHDVFVRLTEAYQRLLADKKRR